MVVGYIIYFLFMMMCFFLRIGLYGFILDYDVGEFVLIYLDI